MDDYRRKRPGWATKEQLEALIKEASEKIKIAVDRQAEVKRAWTALRAQRDTLLGRRTDLLALVSTLEGALESIRSCRRFMREGMLLPYDLEDGKLISKERFEESERFRKSTRWAPRTCRDRIEGLLRSASAILEEEPRLSDEFQGVISDALTDIGSLRETTQAEAAPPSSLVPAEGEPIAQAADAESFDPGVTAEIVLPFVRPARTQELYELVKCVGFVLTCKVAMFAQSRIRAMLEVLIYLDQATEQEVELYDSAVLALSNQHGQRERVDQSTYVIKRWRKTSATWIQYKPNPKKNTWGLKLAARCAPDAEALMERKGLTSDAIRAARDRRRAAKDEAWKAKGKPRYDKPTDEESDEP